RQARGAGDTHRREHRPDGAWRAPREHGAGRDRHRRGEGVTPRSLTTSMDEATASFGSGLRWWRERRGFSQFDLAGAAETTQRHLSFLESGRASPSPEMVLRLATVLGIPLRQQNALLLAAASAPAWRESDLSAPELAQVNGALDFMLAQQEPYPAFVVDRRWNLRRANSGAGRFVEFLTGPAPATRAASAEPVNLAIALVSPDGLRPFIVNWEEVALYFLRGVQADANRGWDAADGRAPHAAARLPRPPRAIREPAAPPVHDDRDPGNSPRRDLAGDPRRVLLPHGRRHRSGLSGLGAPH